ncbi:HtaA domain-containing protein [Corynebacterium belfantii]
MTGFLVPQAVAEEPASASQCEVVQVIESGTLKWGVKQSYRQYIPNKKLANGNWKVAGDIKEVGDKRGKTSTLRFRECPIVCVRGAWFTSSPRIGRGKPRLVG